MRELLRGAFVIARRDFSATVFSKSFLLFLLAPLFPVIVGLIFGSLTMRAAEQIEPPAVAVIAEPQEFAALAAARKRIADTFENARIVRLVRVDPQADRAAARARALGSDDPPVVAVLDGGLRSPTLTSGLPPGESVVRQLQLIVDAARARPEPSAPARIAVSVTQCPVGPVTSAAERPMIGQAGQGVLFVLTMLLATMLLSQLIEEKSNKIIEVLAAAVPVGGIFLGKLLAMLAVSMLGVWVWLGAGAAAFALLADQGLSALPEPAVGWPIFLLLGLLYFAMSYLLLGALFLGIGAHASTAREVQTLSMPVTMAQIVVFATATVAVGEPDSLRALGAAAFPLSSPYVMLARAAELPEIWPHLVGIAWQLLWVGLILALAARLFRRSVLKSGPSAPRRPSRRAKA